MLQVAVFKLEPLLILCITKYIKAIPFFSINLQINTYFCPCGDFKIMKEQPNMPYSLDKKEISTLTVVQNNNNKKKQQQLNKPYS